jgi:TonB-linked SusC/RagA family outer membrane protein
MNTNDVYRVWGGIFLMALFSIVNLPKTEAQTGSSSKITGVVVSSGEEMPLIGVSVAVKGTGKGTVTDTDGKFSIEAATGETLVFSYIGFLTREVKIENAAFLNVVLSEDARLLDELVVVGYGQMKRSDLTGSVASLTSKDVERTVATTIDQVLSGKIAGVQVVQNSGQPGGGLSVRIRGTNTLTGTSEPLYVIDGMQFTNSGGSTNPLSSINPSDIVSVEVLKDASAAAIYGSQGANGVVMITTKRGEAGKTKVAYDGYFGAQQIGKKLAVLNLREYAAYQNDRAAIMGYGAREEFADPSLLSEGTNWQDELFRTAPMHNHQISLAGGNEKTKFYLSGAYLSQEGIALGSAFDRFTGRINIDNETRSWLKIGADMMFNYSTENVTTTDNNLIRNAINQTPDVPVKDANGEWGGSTEENIYAAYATNPIADAMRIENKRKRTQVTANAYVDIRLTKGLTFRNEVGANLNYGNSYYFKPTQEYGYYTDNVNSSTRSADNSLWWLIKNLLYYDKYAGKHHIGAMLAHEVQNTHWENLSGMRSNFPINTIHELSAGDEKSSKADSGSGSNGIESYFGRVHYSFNDRYLATFTYRADGSTKFGPDYKWGYYPSVAVAWRINNEPFMKNVEAINNLKLRLGWGNLGNQNISDYAYISRMKPVQTIFGTGYLSENISNDEIRWEATESYNIGLDVNLFRNRIEFIADAYLKNTNDLIIDVPSPLYSGTSDNPGGFPGTLERPKVNIGSIRNKGFELTLNSVNIDTRGFQWRSGISFTLNRGEVLRMDSETSTLFGYSGNELMTLTQVGGAIGRFYGYVAEKIFVSEADFYMFDEQGNKKPVAIPENEVIAPNGIWVGDIKWKDVNNDGVINEKDRTFIGDPNPDFTFGFTNTFSYKDLDMTIDLQGVYGNEVYSGLRQSYEMPGGNFGLLRPVMNYARIEWVDPNLPDGNKVLSNVYVKNQGYFIPRITNDDANTNNRISSKFVEDGSFLRVKNISLGYNVPKKVLNKYNLERVRVYVNIQNLFTFTNYSGYDPEIGGSVLLNGYDNGRYPSPRIYTFGLNIGF